MEDQSERGKKAHYWKPRGQKRELAAVSLKGHSVSLPTFQHDLDRAHRVEKQDRPGDIITKFMRFLDHEAVLQDRRKLAGRKISVNTGQPLKQDGRTA